MKKETEAIPVNGVDSNGKKSKKSNQQVFDEFKQQKIPLARIKKIMKMDDDVTMVGAEVPILFSKACEMFITELTIKAYYNSEMQERKTLKNEDLTQAI